MARDKRRPYSALSTGEIGLRAAESWNDGLQLELFAAELGFRSRPHARELLEQLRERIAELISQAAVHGGEEGSADARVVEQLVEKLDKASRKIARLTTKLAELSERHPSPSDAAGGSGWPDEHACWDEHPDFPVADWKTSIQFDLTRASYMEWVAAQLAQGRHAGGLWMAREAEDRGIEETEGGGAELLLDIDRLSLNDVLARMIAAGYFTGAQE